MVKTYKDNGKLQYVGQIQNGKRHGYGEEYDGKGLLQYRGLWKNDEIVYPKFPKKYKLVKKNIGKGGQGVIALYLDTTTNNLVAVKKYLRKRSGVYQYRNLQYISELKNVSHSFMKIYGLFEKNDQLFLVMEYLQDYVTLSKVRISKMMERILVCQKIWNQVKILHNNNIVHCDLKPQNIMVDPKTLNVQLIDFGGAIILSKNPKEKYRLKSYTRNYVTIDTDQKHSAQTLKKNDIRTIVKILYKFLFQTDKSRSEMTMKNNLKKYISFTK